MGEDASGPEIGSDNGPLGGDGGVDRSLVDLIETTGLGGEAFDAGLDELEGRHGAAVYARLLSLLCHLDFGPEEARRQWGALLSHHRKLEERWGEPVDLRVALASFFIQVDRRLENPTIIEMRVLEQTQAFAFRDELTGLRNYRFFELYLFHELQRSEQYAWPLSLILLDIDDFKAFNDRYGHGAGNEALATVGRLLAASCRRVDISARFGGEEFAIIAPATPKLGAQRIAERAREAVAVHDWSPAHLTISAGVATFPGDASDGEQLMRRADEALYLAKAKGKNQVQLYGDSRRSHRRVAMELGGTLLAPALAPHPISTIDVSEAGVRFLCDAELAPETLVDLELALPGSEAAIRLGGRVVESADDSTRRQAAVRVVDLSARDRRLLLEHLDAVEAANQGRRR